MGEVTKKSGKANEQTVGVLVIGLYDPGMTPLLRAGLGGLAASLRARYLEQDRGANWLQADDTKVNVPIGDGVAEVESQKITLRFGPGGPKPFLQSLFEHAFRLREPHKVIDLPGTYEVTKPVRLSLLAAGHTAVTLTFLQHGKSRPKAGPARTVSIDREESLEQLLIHPVASYAHQGVWEEIAAAIPGRTLRLAGWANPGAAGRHYSYPETNLGYTPAQALCGCFALVGCLSLQGSHNSGILITLEPDHLLRFAAVRPLLAPQKLADAFVTGASDAVLTIESALRMERGSELFRHRGVGNVTGVLMRATPWDQKQKYRARMIEPLSIEDAILEQYASAAHVLPTKMRILSDVKEGKDSFFPIYSELRAFISENLATGRRWFQDFATAKTDDPKRPKFLHRYWGKDDDLGALRPEERKGLITMTTHLSAAEQSLVRSVHLALRLRYGAIAEECQGNETLRSKRFQKEYDRWRFSLAGSKTHEQVRAVLTDLWSRAGRNSELQSHWQEIIPLLRADQWQTARDLSLLALASYSRLESKPDSDLAAEPSSFLAQVS